MERLRILTEKSVLKLGKYWNWSVEKIIKYDKMYLRWVYYNIEKISFTDQVLSEILLDDDVKIQKPGIDKDFFYFKHGTNSTSINLKHKSREELSKLSTHLFLSGKSDTSLAKTVRRVLKKKKQDLAQMYRSPENVYTKATMQGKNHGR